METIKSFYNYLLKLTTLLQNNKKILFNSKQKKKLYKFISEEIKEFKNDDKKLSKFLLIFLKTVQDLNLITIEDRISEESINQGFGLNPKKDMHLLITFHVSFNKVWLRLKEEEKSSLINILDNMYINSLLYLNYLEENKKITEEEFELIPISVTEYKTELQGRGQLVKYIINDGINKNIKITRIEKKEAKIASSILVDDTIKNMELNGIKDEKDLDPSSLFMNPNMSKSISSTTEKVKRNLHNKVYKKDNLADIMTSLLGTCKDNNQMTSDPKMKILLNTLAHNLHEKKKKNKNLKHDRAATKIIDEIIDLHYDPNAPIDEKQLKKMMKKQNKFQKVHVRK